MASASTDPLSWSQCSWLTWGNLGFHMKRRFLVAFRMGLCIHNSFTFCSFYWSACNILPHRWSSSWDHGGMDICWCFLLLRRSYWRNLLFMSSNCWWQYLRCELWSKDTTTMSYASIPNYIDYFYFRELYWFTSHICSGVIPPRHNLGTLIWKRPRNAYDNLLDLLHENFILVLSVDDGTLNFWDKTTFGTRHNSFASILYPESPSIALMRSSNNW